MLEVTEIPGDNEIRELLDMTKPSNFSGVYQKNLKTADSEGIIGQFRVLDGEVLIAFDGTWFHSSENIHCEHCLHKEHNGKTTYYHAALAGTTVKPGDSAVIPVMPEMITNKDGAEKQDCELNAAKRWLSNHADEAVFFDDIQVNIDAANKLGIHGVLWAGLEDAKKALRGISAR